MSIFYDIFRHAPDRTALAEPGFAVTYGDLPTLIESRAEKIRQYRCVALALDNGVEWALWDLAALSASVPLVPLPPFFTKDMQSHAMKTAGCDAIITADGLFALPHRPVSLPEATAKVTYTSGTTGQPKGVCLSSEGMALVAESIVAVLGTDMAGIHLCVLPLGVLLENVAGVYATLIAGGTVFFQRLGVFGPGYEHLHRVLAESAATSVITVPEILRTLMEQVAQAGSLPNLRYVAVGGSKVSPDLVAKARDLGLPVYEGYGLSECASVVALNTPGNDRIGSVGKILPHVRMSQRDGELIVRNTGFLGYVGETGPVAIQTGDLGSVDVDGFVTITGRKKNVLITSLGRNVSPEWVEAELLSQREIAQAVVYGDGEKTLRALIVPSSQAADVAGAVARANTGLPDYARVGAFDLVPQFTQADGTLTGTGRPRRQHILQRYQKEEIHDVL